MFNEKMINVLRRGTDAIVAIPMDMVDGSLDEAKADVAHIFGCDPKVVTANMQHKDVPPGKYYVWRIKGYKRPARLRQPGGNLFVSWSKINEIEDKNLGLVDTSSGARAVGRGAHEDAEPKLEAKPSAAAEARALADEIEGDSEMAALRAEVVRLTALVENLPTRAEINELATAFAHLSRAVTVAVGARAK